VHCVEDVIGRQVMCTVERLLLGGRSCALCRGCYWEAGRVHCGEAVIGHLGVSSSVTVLSCS
jgi:hypothetical protein